MVFEYQHIKIVRYSDMIYMITEYQSLRYENIQLVSVMSEIKILHNDQWYVTIKYRMTSPKICI